LPAKSVTASKKGKTLKSSAPPVDAQDLFKESASLYLEILGLDPVAQSKLRAQVADCYRMLDTKRL
jgi:hypothetical protein